MTHDSHGLHHYQKRKTGKSRKIIDRLIYVIGILGPILTIPQVTKIWIEQNSTGVSAISWSAYLVFAIFWVIYGILHREKPIIFTYSIWIFLDILIVVGTLIYG